MNFVIHTNAFIRAYQLEAEYADSTFERKLGNAKLRSCRYCKLKYPKVSFRRNAHLVLQLLGKNRMTVLYECDGCNEEFGEYENALTNALGIYRALYAIEGQRGIPKFKNGDFELASERLSGERVSLNINSFTPIEKGLPLDKEGDFTYEIPLMPYKPSDAHRSMLHAAYGGLHGSVIREYNLTRLWLKRKIRSPYGTKFPALLHQSFGSAEDRKFNPTLLIYKRRNAEALIPERVAVVLSSAIALQVGLYNDAQLKARKENPSSFAEPVYDWTSPRLASLYRPITFETVDYTSSESKSDTQSFKMPTRV